MSFPGPRPRKEPSPPFKDPNPDKELNNRKLTTIGKRIKNKAKTKIDKIKLEEFAKKTICKQVDYSTCNDSKQIEIVNNTIYDSMKEFHMKYKLLEVRFDNGHFAAYLPSEEEDYIGRIAIGTNQEIKSNKGINLKNDKMRNFYINYHNGKLGSGGIHSMFCFPSDKYSQTKAAVLHEMGHHLHFNDRFFDRINTYLGIDKSVGKYDRNLENYKEYAITDRAKYNLAECIAENFAIYNSSSKSELNPKMIRMLDLMKKGNW